MQQEADVLDDRVLRSPGMGRDRQSKRKVQRGERAKIECYKKGKTVDI